MLQLQIFLQMRFSRLLDTNDDKDLAFSNKPIFLIWALGSINSVDHTLQTASEHSSKGAGRVNLFDSCGNIHTEESVIALLFAHGIIMIFGELIFLI